MLAGRVVRLIPTRRSPAGLPITRFVLDHHSRQVEANHPRDARCRITVMACGESLSRVAAALSVDTVVRVCGFISRANHRTGEARLVLHADRIELL